MNDLRRSMRELPVGPWLALYAVGLAFNAVNHFVYEPAGYVAAVLMLVAPAGVAVVGLLAIVRGSRTQRGLQWCAFLGGAAVFAIQTWSIVSSGADADGSIGGLPVVFLAGLIAMVVSAGLARSTVTGRTV